MRYTQSEVKQFIEENDVKFIRLAFCDLFGRQRNISIMPEQLEKAFQGGVTVDPSPIEGFNTVAESDLYLIPDPSTLNVLPWRPSHGRVIRFFCKILGEDGQPFSLDSRSVLKEAIEACHAKNLSCNIGTECEFYLFKSDENGKTTGIPLDEAGYMDIAPAERGENVRREICLMLEAIDIQPESSHHEKGPGQNEIDFKYSDALSAADNYMTFKATVSTVAAGNGLYASFDPKPIEGCGGNGLHINMSLTRDGVNMSGSEESNSFIAGIMDHIREISAFLNPLPSSYKRLGEMYAPTYVSWSSRNIGQLVRIPKYTGEAARFELRSPDPMINPYLTFALLIYAGLDGIERKLQLPEPVDLDLSKADASVTEKLQRLPVSLKEAAELCRGSSFVKRVLPAEVIEAYVSRNSSLI